MPKAFRNVTKASIQSKSKSFNGKWIKNAMKSIGLSTQDSLKELYPNLAEVTGAANEARKNITNTLRSKSTDVNGISDSLKKNKYVQAAGTAFKNALEDLKAGNFNNTERLMGSMGGQGEDTDVSDSFEFDDDDSSDISFGDEDTPTTNNVNFNVVNQGSSDNGAMLAFQEQSRKQTEAIVKTNKARMDAQIATASASMYQMEKLSGEVIGHLSNISNSLTALVDYQNQNMTKFIEASLGYYEKVGSAQLSDDYDDDKRLVGSDIFNSDTKGGINIANYKRLIVQQLKETFRDSQIGGLEMLADEDTLNMLASNPLGFGMKFLTTKMVTTLVGSTIDSVEKTFSTFVPSMLEKLADMGDEYSTTAVGMLKQNIGRIFGIRVKQEDKIDAAKVNKGPIPFDGETKHAITEIITKELREQTSYLKAIANRFHVKTDEAKLDSEVWDYNQNKYIKVRDVQSNIASEIQDTFLDNIKSGEFGKAMNNMIASQEGKKAQQALEQTLDEMLTMLGKVNHSVDLKDFSEEGDLNQVARELIKNNKKETGNVRVILDYLQQLSEINPDSLNDFSRARLKANASRNSVLSDINNDPTRYNLFASGLNGQNISEIINREYGYGEYSKNKSRGARKVELVQPSQEENTGLIGSMFSNFTGHVKNQMHSAMRGNYADANMEIGGMVKDQAKILLDKTSDTVLSPLKEAFVGPTHSGEPSVLDNLKSFGTTIKEGISAKLFGEKDEKGKRKSDGLLSFISKTFKEGWIGWQEAFIGRKMSDEEKEKAMETTLKTFKDRLPATLTGTVVGTGVGTAFGGLLGNLVGGPFAGAILGSVTGFLSESDNFKNWLFGEKDKNGDRTGGLINKQVQTFAKENKNKLIGGAAIGAGLGAIGISGGGVLGTLVGGPVAGAVMGLASTIFLKSKTFSKFLFGDEDRGQKGIFEAVKSAFSAGFSGHDGQLNESGANAGMSAIGIGVGALTGAALTKFGVLGAALGPMGPIGGALAGLGLTIQASGSNFKEWLFGKDEEDVNGNKVHKEGVLGQFKNMLNANVFRPLIHSAQGIIKNIDFTLKHDVLQPFAFVAEKVSGIAGEFAGGIKDTIVGGLNQFGTLVKENIINQMGAILSPFTKTISKASEIISKTAMKTMSLPFKAMQLGIAAFTSKLNDLTKPVRFLLDETRRLIFKGIGKITSYTMKGIGGILKTIGAPIRFVGGLLETGVGKATNFLDRKLKKYGVEPKYGNKNMNFAGRLKAAKQSREYDKQQLAKWKKETKIHDQNAKLIAKYTKNQYSTDSEEGRLALKRANIKAYQKLVGETEETQAKIAKEGKDVSKMSSNDIAKANVKNLNPIGKIVYYTQGLFNSLARNKNWDGKSKKDGEHLTQEEKEERKRKQEEQDREHDERLQEENQDYAPKEYSFRRYLKSNAIGLKEFLLGKNEYDAVTGRQIGHSKNILSRQVDNVKGEIEGAKEYGRGVKRRYLKMYNSIKDNVEGRHQANRAYRQMRRGTYVSPREQQLREMAMQQAQEQEPPTPTPSQQPPTGGSGKGFVRNLLSKVRGGRGDEEKVVSVKIDSLSDQVENILSSNSAKVAETIINEDNKDEAKEEKTDAKAEHLKDVKERGTSASEKQKEIADHDAKIADAKEKGKSAKEQIEEKEKQKEDERQEEIKENTKKGADATLDFGFHWKSIFGKKGLITGGLILLAPLALKVFKWLWKSGKGILEGFSKNGIAGAIAAALGIDDGGNGENGEGTGIMGPLKTIAGGITTITDFGKKNGPFIVDTISTIGTTIATLGSTVTNIFEIFKPVADVIGNILSAPSKILGKALGNWAKTVIKRNGKGYGTNGETMTQASKKNKKNTEAALEKFDNGDYLGGIDTYLTDENGNVNHETYAKEKFLVKGVPGLAKKQGKRLVKKYGKKFKKTKKKLLKKLSAKSKIWSKRKEAVKNIGGKIKTGGEAVLEELTPQNFTSIDNNKAMSSLAENFGDEGAEALAKQYGSAAEAAEKLLGTSASSTRRSLGGKIADKAGVIKNKLVSNKYTSKIANHIDDFKSTKGLVMKTNAATFADKTKNTAKRGITKSKDIAKRGASKLKDVAKKGVTKVSESKAATIAKSASQSIKTLVKDKVSNNKVLNTVISMVKKFFSFVVEKCGSRLGGKIGNGVASGLLKKVLQGIAAGSKTIITKATKILAGAAAKAATVVGFVLSDVGSVTLGAINGVTGAARLFQIDSKYVDAKMRIISGVIGGLAGTTTGSIIDMVNEVVAGITQADFLTELACTIYKAISGKTKDKKLDKARKSFEDDYNKYKDDKITKAYYKALKDGDIPEGTKLDEFKAMVANGEYKVKYKSFSDYNDSKHQTIGSKIAKATHKGLKLASKALSTGKKAIKSGIKKAGSTIKKGAASLASSVKKAGSTVKDAITHPKQTAKKAVKKVKKTAAKLVSGISSTIKEISPFKLKSKNESVYLDDSDGSYYKSDGTHYSANGTKIGSIKQTELLDKMKNNEVRETTIDTNPASLDNLYKKTVGKFVSDSQANLKKLSKTWAKGSKIKRTALKIASTGLKAINKTIKDRLFGGVFKAESKSMVYTDVSGNYYKPNGGKFDYYSANGDLIQKGVSAEEVKHKMQVGMIVKTKEVKNTAAQNTIKSIHESLSNLWDSAGSLASKAVNGVKSFVSNIFNKTDDSSGSGGTHTKTTTTTNGVAAGTTGGSGKSIYPSSGIRQKNVAMNISDYVPEKYRKQLGGAGNGLTKEKKSIHGGRGDDRVNGFSYYSQSDPRWKDKAYNTGQDNATMDNTGCGPAAMSMVASQMTGQNVDPMETASLAKATGDRDNTGTNWNFINKAAGAYGINSQEAVNPSAQYISDQLDQGKPMILSGASGGGYGNNTTGVKHNSAYTPAGHYVVAVGKDQNGNVLINDPRGKQYSGKYDLNDVASETGAAWSFDNGGSGKGNNILRRSRFGGYGKKKKNKSKGGGNNFTAQDVINVAIQELGYLEKKSNSQLNDKTANTGKNSGNYTKYERDIFGSNGNFWCCTFVTWCMWTAANHDKEKVKSVMGSWSAACNTAMEGFKRMNRFDKNPQPGDCIFFSGHRHGGSNHIGIVEKVSGNQVHTIEGNTSTKKGVVDNGGGVARKTYSLNNSRIMGYGHPKYDGTSNYNGSSGTQQNATTFPQYKLSSSIKTRLAKLIAGEAGNDRYADMEEASQIANLNELHFHKPATEEELKYSIRPHSQGGWYADKSFNASATKNTKDAVKLVFEEGKRTLPRYVTEHDWFPHDIKNPKSRKSYKVGDDVHNKMGSNYKFYKFFGKKGPEGSGDIAGYFPKDYKKYKNDVPWQMDKDGNITGAGSASSDGTGGSSDATTETTEKTSIFEGITNYMSAVGTAAINGAITGNYDLTEANKILQNIDLGNGSTANVSTANAASNNATNSTNNTSVANSTGDHIPKKAKSTGNAKAPHTVSVDGKTYTISNKKAYGGWINKHGCSLEAMEMGIQKAGGPVKSLTDLYKWSNKNLKNKGAKVGIHGVMKAVNSISGNSNAATWHPITKNNKSDVVSGINSALDNGSFVLLERGDPVHTTTFIGKRKNGNPAEVTYGTYRQEKKYDHPASWYYNGAAKGTKSEKKQTDWWHGQAKSSGYVVVNGNGPSGGSGGGFGTGVKQTTHPVMTKNTLTRNIKTNTTTGGSGNKTQNINNFIKADTTNSYKALQTVVRLLQQIVSNTGDTSSKLDMLKNVGNSTTTNNTIYTGTTNNTKQKSGGSGKSVKTKSESRNGNSNNRNKKLAQKIAEGV